MRVTCPICMHAGHVAWYSHRREARGGRFALWGQRRRRCAPIVREGLRMPILTKVILVAVHGELPGIRRRSGTEAKSIPKAIRFAYIAG